MEKMVHISYTANRRGELDVSYFAKNPDVVKIFDDLEKFKNFCRFEGYRFNEKDLYDNKSRAYSAFLDPQAARAERKRRRIARYKKRKLN